MNRVLTLYGLRFDTFFGISIGFKRRMIAIGKTITFYFLQNVWKCFVFWAFALKVWKNANMTQTIFFQLKFIWGIKKRRILCWLQIRWNGLEKTVRKKGIGKKRSEKVQNPKNSKFASFYAYNFFLESFFEPISMNL